MTVSESILASSPCGSAILIREQTLKCTRWIIFFIVLLEKHSLRTIKQIRTISINPLFHKGENERDEICWDLSLTMKYAMKSRQSTHDGFWFGASRRTRKRQPGLAQAVWETPRVNKPSLLTLFRKIPRRGAVEKCPLTRGSSWMDSPCPIVPCKSVAVDGFEVFVCHARW